MPIPRIYPQTPQAASRVQTVATPDSRGFSVDLAPSMRAQQPVQVDPRGFMQGAAGLASIGQTIGQAGDALFQAEKAQQDMINLRKEHDAGLALEDYDAQIDEALAKELDETKWPVIAQQIAQKAASSIMDPARNPLSPVAREAIQDKITQWTTRKIAAAKVDSIRTSHSRAADSISAQLMTAMNNRDYTGAETIARQGIAARILPATQLPRVQGMIREAQEQAKKEAEATAREAEQTAFYGEAEADPDAAAAKIGTPEWRTGKSPADIANAQRMVDGIRAQRLNEGQDALAIYLQKPIGEQTRAGLEASLPRGLRPADQARLLGSFDAIAVDRAKANYNTPEEITKRFGILLDSADKFDLEAMGGTGSQEARDAYVAIMAGAQTLPESLRGKITGPINDKWNARAPTISSITESYAKDQVKNLYETGQLGAFRSIDPLTQKEVVNAQKQADASVRRANLEIAMDQWFQANPNATPQQAREQIESLSSVVIREGDANKILQNSTTPPVAMPTPETWFNIRGRLQRAQGMPDTGEAPSGGLFPSQPGAQGVIGPAGSAGTARTSGRVTSYGYEGDSTPDKYSSMGIGSFSGDAAIAAARRGQDHPMRLQPGDLAVSPDIERQLRAAGVKPTDEIEITYADGRTHRGRWMDRTANDTQAKKLGLRPLRGRWDIYSPAGPSAENDTPVTSFRKL